jgi:hypothetical protein
MLRVEQFQPRFIDEQCRVLSHLDPKVLRRGSSITPQPTTRANKSGGPSLREAALDRMETAAIAEIALYEQLAPGWDGYGADAFSRLVLDAAILFVRAGARMIATAGVEGAEIHTGPAGDGSIDVELRTRSKRLILTIYPGTSPDHFEVHTYREAGPHHEERRSVEAAAVVSELRWLVS